MCPAQGAKRPLDTIVESSEGVLGKGRIRHLICWCFSEGRGSLWRVQARKRVPSAPDQVRGTFLEVVDHRFLLLQEVLRWGLEVHHLSGVVDVARVEPLDDVNVAVKRGEVDWLNVVRGHEADQALQGGSQEGHLVERARLGKSGWGLL